MFNGNKKFELFLTDFYAVASESVAESEEINEKKSWALLNPEKGFVRKIAVNDYTKRQKQAAKWKDIKSATKAGKEFTKYHGVDVIVQAIDEAVNEGKMPDRYVGLDDIVYVKVKEDRNRPLNGKILNLLQKQLMNLKNTTASM